jgi:hypothetical protein
MLEELASDPKLCLSLGSDTKFSSSLTKIDASSCTLGFVLVRLLLSIAIARLCVAPTAAHFTGPSIYFV